MSPAVITRALDDALEKVEIDKAVRQEFYKTLQVALPPMLGNLYGSINKLLTEDVAAHTRAPFQLYVMRDRGFIERLIERARAAACGTLVLTLDLQIMGQRHKDLKNGLSAPPRRTPRHLLGLLTRPRWCLGMLRAQRRHFGTSSAMSRA